MTLAPYRYRRPFFGEFGSIATVGDRLVCHLCGRDFLSLAKHIEQAHGLSPDQYREAYGLNRTHSLWASSLQRRQSEAQTRRGFGEIGRRQLAKNVRPVAQAHAARRENLGRLQVLARANAQKANRAAREAGVLDWRSRQQTCKRGHPFNESNTGHWGPGNGWRRCRLCDRDRMREVRARA